MKWVGQIRMRKGELKVTMNIFENNKKGSMSVNTMHGRKCMHVHQL